MPFSNTIYNIITIIRFPELILHFQRRFLLISLIATVVIIVIAFRILITVYGRGFKILLYAVLAPLALSCFAGESTSSYGLSYVRVFGLA